MAALSGGPSKSKATDEDELTRVSADFTDYTDLEIDSYEALPRLHANVCTLLNRLALNLWNPRNLRINVYLEMIEAADLVVGARSTCAVTGMPSIVRFAK